MRHAGLQTKRFALIKTVKNQLKLH